MTANAVCSTFNNRAARRTLSLLDPTGTLGGAKYGFVNAWDSNGTRSYHGMLLSLNKRMSNDFSVTANYTWSHCISDPVNNFLHGTPGVGVWNDPTNRSYDRGNCSGGGDDIRHIVNSTAVINTPQFSNRAANAILGNWRVSGILRARSGSWQTAMFTNESSGTGGNINSQYPNLVSNDSLRQPVHHRPAFEQSHVPVVQPDRVCRSGLRHAGQLSAGRPSSVLEPGLWTSV